MNRLRELRAGADRSTSERRWRMPERRRRSGMGTINSAFSIMTGALDADQAALNVVANNVANANTAGIHRRDARTGRRMRRSRSVGVIDRQRRNGNRRDVAARPRAGGAAGSAAAVGLGVEYAAFSAEQHSGAVYAGFRLVERDGRRHRQRHYELLRFLFVARGRSDRQRTARAGAFVGVDACRGHFERGHSLNAQSAAIDQEACRRGRPGELADRARLRS